MLEPAGGWGFTADLAGSTPGRSAGSAVSEGLPSGAVGRREGRSCLGPAAPEGSTCLTAEFRLQ